MDNQNNQKKYFIIGGILVGLLVIIGSVWIGYWLDDKILIFLVICAFLWVLFNILKYGGVKGAMFRGKILRTVGSIKGTRGWSSQKGITRGELKVHVIELKSDNKEKGVGLELIYKTPLSYRMTPMTLSPTEARSLIQLIEEALNT